MRDRPLSGSRLGVFGKGGAGKSTVTVFVAETLQALGYSVLVLDADSTNVGLADALGVDREPEPLLEYFGGMVFSGGVVTCPVDDPLPLIGAEVALGELPPRFVARTPSGVRLLVAGKLGALGPGAGCDGPVAKIARDLRVSDHGLRPVELVDFKAGFEDAARGVLTSVDWALVAVDPTTAALRVAKDLAEMVTEIRRGVPPATRHLERAEQVEAAERVFAEARVQGVRSVLNRVPTRATETYLREALRESGVDPVGVFRDDSSVAEQWLRGEALHSEAMKRAAESLVGTLEAVADEARSAARA